MKSKLNFFRNLALLVAGLTCFLAAAANGHSGMVGDLNGDGRHTIGDVTSLIGAVLNDGAVTDVNDIDCDGRLSISDVTTLIDMVLCPARPSQRYVVNGVFFSMVNVEGGTFVMGATEGQSSEANYDEYPAHQVALSSYSIGQTQVTQALWEAVMGYNPSGCVINPQCPVENVSWDDCQEFIQNLNTLTGCSFRLPTEAEWEFAASGGNYSRQYLYSGSNNYNDVAWCELNSDDRTQPVASKMPNELGIYDMSGNVWEWCQDWWGLFDSGNCINPTGPETGDSRVCHGGCMRGHVRFCRIGYRMDYPPDTRRIDLGLRIAL